MAVEKWILNGLLLNSDPWRIENLEFAPAPRQPQWIKSQDSDGALLVQDPVTDLAEMTFRLRHAAGYTEDQVYANLLELSKKAASCSQDPGGVSLVNVPHEATDTSLVSGRITYSALLGELVGVPRAVTGSDIGWFIRRPVVSLRVTCHPFGELAGLADIPDTFSSDNLATWYTFGTGSGTLSVSGGLLVPSSTAEKELALTVNQWPFYDAQVSMKMTTGASVAGPWGVSATAKRLDASNFLMAEVAFSGASSNVKIWKKDGGSFTQLGSSSSNFTPTTATSYWVVLRVEGNLVTAEVWSAAPTVTGTALRSTTHTLTGGDITKFGLGVSGSCGIRTSSVPTDWRYDDFLVQPNLWRSALPMIDRVVYGIPGDAPPKANLITWNGSSTTHIRYEELGLGDDVTSASIIDSDSLVTTGFSGTQTTRTGAYDPNASGNNVIRATMTQFATAVCGTGAQTHQGRFRVKARVYQTVASGQVRLAWQNEDGPLTRTDYVTPPADNAWTAVDLGVINVTSTGIGIAGWNGRVEAYNSGGGTLDVDFLALIPVNYGYGRMGVDVAQDTGTLTAYDAFTGTTAGGALNARVPPVGAAWATSGVATDFTFRDSDATWPQECVTRATTDAGFRYAVFGSVAAGQAVGASMGYVASVTAGFVLAVIARWVDANNHLRLQFTPPSTYWPQSTPFSLVKVVAGVSTTLASGSIITSPAPNYARCDLTVYPTGRAVCNIFGSWNGQTATFEATDAVLATGGALDDGLVGIADDGASTTARFYDDVVGFTLPDEPIVIYSSRDLRITDKALRANSTGTQYGVPPSGYHGTFPKPPPAAVGPARVAAIVSPTDLQTSTWETINHSVQHQFLWTPRVRVVPE